MSDKKTLVLPVVLITVGFGWLLSSAGVMPSIDWLWTLGLAVSGGLAFAVAGWDKVTAVVGPMLMAASGLSMLRQSGHITLGTETPILVMLLGVLLLVARSPKVPRPQWLLDAAESGPDDAVV